ncbi:MAG TPA: hypothetical protein VHE30_11210 [Polyangiaceae bacterium]|nr:hypothetical protein [Polyangiaceae bacterium]
MRGSYLALLGAGAAVAVACSVYDETLLKPSPSTGSGGGSSGGEGGSPGTGGAGGNTGGNGGGGGSTACVEKRWVDPPADSDVITRGGDEEAIGVMYKIDLGDAPSNPTDPPKHYLDVGFDVDGKCTFGTGDALKKGQECNVPSWGFGVADGPGGTDNALGQIIQLTRDAIKTFSSEIYSTQLQQGVTNVIVHLTDYNGEANDDQVTVATLVSAPFDSPPRAKGTHPKWDGTDEWPIASDALKDGKNVSDPKFIDKSAYVTNHKIVTKLNTTAMRLVTALTDKLTVNLQVEMTDAHIQCDLVENTAMPRVWNWVAQNCVLEARWLVNSLLHQLSQFPDPATNLPLCRDANLYGTFRDNICNLVDVAQYPGATADDCNAISMGLVFDTKPALIGNVYQVQSPKEPCPVGARPSEDDCSLPAAGSGGTGNGGAGGQGGASGGGGASGSGGAAGGSGAAGASNGGASSGGAGSKDAGGD